MLVKYTVIVTLLQLNYTQCRFGEMSTKLLIKIKKALLRLVMSKASSRGFGFTAIAIVVCLMALSAFLTKAEAVCLICG